MSKKPVEYGPDLGGKQRLTLVEFDKLKAEIKMMLHAHRDCLRNRWQGNQMALECGRTPSHKEYDPRKVRFDISDGYYGEAFGVLRAIAVLGYGAFGPVNHNHNLNALMYELEKEVLEEEGFDTDHTCTYCMERYRKDDSTL
jgi:hypothetical protein